MGPRIPFPWRPADSSRHFRSAGNTRAVSTVVAYTLGLVITTLLLTGLVVGIGDFVQDQRERTVRSQLDVVGSQLSSDLRDHDTLVLSAVLAGGSPGSVALESERELPDTAAGTSYVLRLENTTTDPGADVIVLSTDTPDVEVTVRLSTSGIIAVREARLAGGNVHVEFNTSSPPTGTIGELVVEDA